MDKIKVILVDDQAVFRKAVSILLGKAEDIEVVGEASNGKEFLKLLANCHADVVLMDLKMPIMDGAEATKKAKFLYPDLKIIALTMYGEFDSFKPFLDAGICGFILKDTVNEKLVNSIRLAKQGKCEFFMINQMAKTRNITIE
ncbi:MAG: response regulator transcription factor [Saprospiraceae bacterium]|nr:response regulator transcription factor [Saprospiraceae bacterium]